GSNGRLRQKDCTDPATRASVDCAVTFYRCRISTVNAFPNHDINREFVQASWEDGCMQAGLKKPLPLTSDIAKLATSNLRGQLKTKARPIVESRYGFESGHSKKIKRANRALAEDLKEKVGFAYQSIYDDDGDIVRSGLYKNKAIQSVTNDAWFANIADEGITHAEFFSPLTIPAVALVLTAIECCVDEWATGTRGSIEFSATSYQKIYRLHVKTLERTHEKALKNSNKFMSRL
ncbi:hypothetical protein C8J56DRAFT_742353, partial [Mycena floridula]